MADATTLHFQGISRKENEILQQAEQPTKTGPDVTEAVKSGALWPITNCFPFSDFFVFLLFENP